LEAVGDTVKSGAVDVLIVGAGPTGLTLAAQLRSFGVPFRLIDKNADSAHESRALAVQARTVEIFESLGIGEALVSRGNPSARLALHFEGGGAASVDLGGFATTDTRFPFILFVSQAETEAVLGELLGRTGAVIERGVELVSAAPDGAAVRCTLRHDGQAEQVTARFLVGCDGAHSAVRKQAGVPFAGDVYLQDFMLGDVDADGPIEPDTLHSYAAARSVAMFFPLRKPATWRVIAMRGKSGSAWQGAGGAPNEESLTRGELALPDLQAVVDGATGASVRLRDPVWLTHFRLHHRQAATYRQGRIFLAGDAAHIHSPVGGQGMNTGIQDAWNLGWKLALVVAGRAPADLLDTYQAERWPVGRNLLRYTDRAFSLFTRAMSANRIASWFRRTIVARVVPWIFRAAGLRNRAFKFVSELGIAYPRSPAAAEGTPRLRSGPRAGARLPDAPVERDGRSSYLQKELSGPRFHLLLCGDASQWDKLGVDNLAARYGDLLQVHYLARDAAPGVLVDSAGEALQRLGVRGADAAAQYLVRPDGYIAARCAGRDVAFVGRYLARWATATTAAPSR
jgi:2-polyprenyl-6-methoxyphenol hydroxylase-like FAD-dependent oxidoreductase